jgi:hypothetical protein
MNTKEYWLDSGHIVDRPRKPDGEAFTDRQIFQSGSLVKLVTSGGGTRVTWTQFSANWSSLFFVIEWIKILPGPFTLQFFNAGWFSERYTCPIETIERIRGLIANSDVRLSARVYLQQFDPEKIDLPFGLNDAWSRGEIPESQVVVCDVNLDSERTTVSHVGASSALASVWGVSPVSYPCLSGHSYDKVVSRPYFEVIKTGRPYHDHVLAAMAKPDGEVSWMSYQRLIFPTAKVLGHRRTVHIMCEGAPVDIPVL